MAKIHGRNARLYVGLAGASATAEPVANLNAASLNAASDKVDVTAFGDASKTYVAGLPDASGDFAGFYDTATPQTYTAAADGVARKFYLYPDVVGNPGTYWFGTAFFDFKVETSVSDAAKISGTWAAATPIAKVG